MKKSEIYKLAQVAVIETPMLSSKQKIEILKELIDKEGLEMFVERQKEQEKANEEL